MSKKNFTAALACGVAIIAVPSAVVGHLYAKDTYENDLVSAALSELSEHPECYQTRCNFILEDQVAGLFGSQRDYLVRFESVTFSNGEDKETPMECRQSSYRIMEAPTERASFSEKVHTSTFTWCY